MQLVISPAIEKNKGDRDGTVADEAARKSRSNDYRSQFRSQTIRPNGEPGVGGDPSQRNFHRRHRGRVAGVGFAIMRDDHSASFVSQQRFCGKLADAETLSSCEVRRSSRTGIIKATWFVVPRSSTGDLSGLRGEAALKGPSTTAPTARWIIGSNDVTSLRTQADYVRYSHSMVPGGFEVTS
jgi:hypothetical protein